MAVISVDLGTTGCKAGLFEGGEILGLSYRHYSCASPEEGWAEQDAEAAWSLLKGVVSECLAQASRRPRVEAICLSVQGDAIIPMDAAGNALHPAILGMDTRSHREAADLESLFGRARLYEWTGMPCEPLNAITKIFWLARNRPDLKGLVWKYGHYEEFLLTKLAGKPALDLSMASRTMAFNAVERSWVPEILDAVGIDPSRLGDPCPSGTVVGPVRKELAEELGIDRSAVVVSGAHDQCMAAVGAGVIEPGLGCYSMGTAEVIAACFGEPRKTPEMLRCNYPCYSHAVEGQYFTIALNQSGGLSLEWLLGLWGKAASDEERSAAYAEAISRLEIAPSPVLFLPHLVGSGTPACDHRSRGSFLGLSLKTGRADMFQAAVEALAFEARLNLSLLEGQGIRVSELRAVGGGSHSRRILELKATVLRRPIRTLQVSEAALLGAAMVAQVALGKFRGLREARDACVKTDHSIEPVHGSSKAYDDAFERFRKMYDLLRGFYGSLPT